MIVLSIVHFDKAVSRESDIWVLSESRPCRFAGGCSK